MSDVPVGNWHTVVVRILVTGAAGLLGSVVTRLASDAGHEVIEAVHHREGSGVHESRKLDVTDAHAVDAAVSGVAAVVHTAYRHGGPDSAAVNVEGAANVAHSCSATGARLIHISSDVVFSGEPPRTSGYREDDKVDPIAGFAYGMEKAEAEHRVRAADPDASIVRTTLMYDLQGGSSLEAGVLASAEPDSTMSHFNDEYRCPVHVDDVAAGVLAVLELGDSARPGILHLGGPQRLSRAQIARGLAPHLGIGAASLSEASSSSVPGDRPADLTLDSSLAGDLIGYEPRPL